MAHLEHPRTLHELKARLAATTDPELTAQELVQKGAMDSLVELLARGCTRANAEAMIASLGKYAEAISAECRRRGLPVVRDPRARV